MKTANRNTIAKLKWLILITVIALLGILNNSCEKPGGTFLVDESQLAMYETLQNQTGFEQFLQIIDAANLSSALNSHGSYTLFCPNNDAVENYISKSNYTSMNDLLNDIEFVQILARYHLVMGKYLVSDLGYGAIGDTTATGDFLVVSFGAESEGFDVIINNSATVISKDLEANNGFLHVIDKVLSPIIFDSYEKLLETGEFNIFCEALIETGLRDTLRDFNISQFGDTILNRYTLLAEADTLYNNNNIFSYADLKTRIGGSETGQNLEKIMREFMAFHILDQPLSLTDLETTNYSTFGDELMAVRVEGSIWFNYWTIPGKDTLVDEDGNIQIVNVNLIQGAEPNYFASNIISKNGTIHTLSKIIEPHTPTVQTVKLKPTDLPEFTDVRGKFSTVYFEPNEFERLNWEDTDNGSMDYMFDTGAGGLTGNDYIEMSGLFTMDYVTDKILAGTYDVIINVDNTYSQNATIQCYIDGVKAGGLYDLRKTVGVGRNTFKAVNLGSYTFTRTQVHNFKVEAFIPGRFSWNYIQFEVVK